ncbi:MAG: hypothetical protein D6742_15900 [Cyanobacteria bacterium J069]|nr:MAG: hypothetical protein D6742_15900 [Cyanobacteria bacterium J069]
MIFRGRSPRKIIQNLQNSFQLRKSCSANTPSPLQFDRFYNDDPDILTTIVIGARSHVQSHILRQHTLGVVEAGAWSRLIPLPQCPGKVMSLVNRAMV